MSSSGQLGGAAGGESGRSPLGPSGDRSAPPPPPLPASISVVQQQRQQRVESFKGYVSALNQQFVNWCNGQWTKKPSLFWSSGIHDYLRHAAKIRREFQDILHPRETDADDPDAASPTHASKPPKYEPMLTLMPVRYCKTIHFIRHGEGFHNVGLNTPDSHLTVRGWEQAWALKTRYDRHPATRQVQLVVISPLMRALETAVGAFGLSADEALALGVLTPERLRALLDDDDDVRPAGDQDAGDGSGGGGGGAAGPGRDGGDAPASPAPAPARGRSMVKSLAASWSTTDLAGNDVAPGSAPSGGAAPVPSSPGAFSDRWRWWGRDRSQSRTRKGDHRPAPATPATAPLPIGSPASSASVQGVSASSTSSRLSEAATRDEGAAQGAPPLPGGAADGDWLAAEDAGGGAERLPAGTPSRPTSPTGPDERHPSGLFEGDAALGEGESGRARPGRSRGGSRGVSPPTPPSPPSSPISLSPVRTSTGAEDGGAPHARRTHAASPSGAKDETPAASSPVLGSSPRASARPPRLPRPARGHGAHRGQVHGAGGAGGRPSEDEGRGEVGLSSPGEPVLMRSQAACESTRAAAEARFARPGVSYLAHELCRERLGPSRCDQRRPRHIAQHLFPAVDFRHVESDEDPSWVAGRVESEAAVVKRGMKFLQFLMSRPEDNIAVVTHSAFLWFTLACFGNETARPVREDLQRWYENGESRTIVLSDGGGMGIEDVTWCPGSSKGDGGLTGSGK